MFDNGKLTGVYTIERLNKQTGNIEKVFEKENHLTDSFKDYILSKFSMVFNVSHTKGATNGMINYRSPFFGTQNSGNIVRRIDGSLRLYGLKDIVSNVESLKEYPFLDNLGNVDTSQITFIGDDNNTGDLYAAVIPTKHINLSVPHTISKTWHLVGPNGVGDIKTLCIGYAPDMYRKPLQGKVIAESFVNASTNTRGFVKTYMPPIPNVTGSKFVFGTDRAVNSGWLEYDTSNDTYKDLQTQDNLHKLPLASIQCNVPYDSEYVYLNYSQNVSSNNSIYRYKISDGSFSQLIGSGYGNLFKKGNYLIGNADACVSTSNSNRVTVYNKSTGSQDSSLFGSTSPYLSAIVQNVPTDFTVTHLGTRNDNENYLVLDRAKCWCIECTDVSDVIGTAVNSYFTNNLSNYTINGKLYFFQYNTSGVTSTYASTYATSTDFGVENYNYSGPLNYANDSMPMLSDPDCCRHMLSIITDIKDSQGQPIVQTEDSELYFTYTLKFN